MVSYAFALEVTQSRFYHTLLVQSKSHGPLRFKQKGLHKDVRFASVGSHVCTRLG